MDAVFKMLEAGSEIFEPPALPDSKEIVICLLAQLALVASNVREHLKNVAGADMRRKGMKPGHRGQ